jgi:nucleobase:cation symporter-1, NCS1 family
LSLFPNRIVLVLAMVCLALATLATNIAANVVSPANDFAHLCPRLINFRIGGFITGVIGILIQPWRLLANASVYIDKWLVGYSSLLGAVGGILIADYFVIRKTRLDQAGLYLKNGPYWYTGGFNLRAIFALVVGIGLCAPGFAAALGWVSLAGTPPAEGAAAMPEIAAFWGNLYSYAWFTSFGTAFALYMLLMIPEGLRSLQR